MSTKPGADPNFMTEPIDFRPYRRWLAPLPTSARRAPRSEPTRRKGAEMKANVGDWLVMKGTTTELSDKRGLITEVRSADGSPPYVVRWLDSEHEATVYPGSDAVVVTAAEQEVAGERVQSRVESVQNAITHHFKSE